MFLLPNLVSLAYGATVSLVYWYCHQLLSNYLSSKREKQLMPNSLFPITQNGTEFRNGGLGDNHLHILFRSYFNRKTCNKKII